MTFESPNEALAEAEAASVHLVDGSGKLLSWEWDDRLSAALASVEAPNDRDVLELVGAVFSDSWEHEDLEQAPESVRALASDWGGLAPGQRLFALDPASDPLLFAAWWPWGNGTTFSLRVGCAARSAEAEETDAVAMLRGWFSV